ncbi:1-aminocyclopropane-1-carboxylate synthase-like protein [Colletotrichum kahawae]|uniref:1-aminocyclopropane-1-carboxylate synthase-like protein n=1 Tax=Colletotrichum kahawae TaxID=34407 RepID=A0AAE0CXE4_COLKA|nr:1-aminocyclopropane-1-carboxylate synthase-like protein [Colletotrichum kahawae]
MFLSNNIMSADNNALPPSRRGRQNVRPDLMIDLSRQLEENKYHPTKSPKGIIDLGSAVNELMLEDIAGWTRWNVKRGQLKNDLGYNDTQGSPELLKAAAEFMNEHFRARIPLTLDNILAANGVTTLLDTLAFNIADEGESILLPTPSYGMFSHDVSTRNSVRIVQVPCDDIPDERFAGPHAQQDEICRPSELVVRLETAIENELHQGRKVAAILLANPENPLGRCYAPSVLLQVSQLCARHKLHLIVDEIYAMSAGDGFSSMLSLGLDTNFRNVHVLWGMSKDFGLGGLRIGGLEQTLTVSSMFGWVSSFSASLATKLLSDRKYLRDHYSPVYRRRLNKRRLLVESELKRFEIPYMEADSGFFMLIDLSDWLDQLFARYGKDGELDLLEYIIDNRVFLEPGKAFFCKSAGWFRLNFGGEKHTVKTGLQRLFQCLRSLESKGEPLVADDATPHHPPRRHLTHLTVA